MLEAEAEAKRNSELLSTAGSLLGGLLGGRKSKGAMIGDILGDAGTAARRRGSTSASGRRVDAAENKAARLADQLAELEADAAADIAEIAEKWDGLAANVTTLEVGLERTDVKVTQLALAWIPVGLTRPVRRERLRRRTREQVAHHEPATLFTRSQRGRSRPGAGAPMGRSHSSRSPGFLSPEPTNP